MCHRTSLGKKDEHRALLSEINSKSHDHKKAKTFSEVKQMEGGHFIELENSTKFR